MLHTKEALNTFGIICVGIAFVFAGVLVVVKVVSMCARYFFGVQV